MILNDGLILLLLALFNGAGRPPALRPFAYIKYAYRELQPEEHEDGTVSVKLTVSGWEYKHRGKRPRMPPTLDIPVIQTAVDKHLSAHGFAVDRVENKTYFIVLYIIRKGRTKDETEQ